MRRKLALVLLVGVSGTLGCKSAPWSNSEPTPAGATAPNTSMFQFDSLSKAFSPSSSTKPSAVGGPVAQPSDNFLVSSWKKTSAAISAPFASNSAPKLEDDPVSLSHMPSKVGPEVYIAAAQMHESQGRYPEAEAKYLAALKTSPNDLNTHIGLARLYDRQNLSTKAVDVYRKALQKHPKSAIAYNDLGLCYARQNSHDQAAQYLTKAVELAPDNARYRNNLATVLIATGKTDEAVRQLAAVNNEAIAHYNVACLLQMEGKQQQAVTHLHAALDRDPQLGQAREMLAQLGPAQSPAPYQPARVAAQTVSASSTPAPAPGPYSAAPYGNAPTPPPVITEPTTTTAQPQSNFSPWR